MTLLKSKQKVLVISGEGKGKKTTVIAFKGKRVFLEGIRKYKRMLKPRQGLEGGCIEKPFSVHYSNIKLIKEELEKSNE